ncbi:GTP pyrophosphokinase [Ruminiclostridium cellulolyticum]|uniref:RelA/SpoT domain protein n=1 Tax=Ruminiclostridium cellulolyticum (strain ATCC 35319 / DSM 5812 / JCM 6584 / H10) TaxID=394503 RepID=B8I337_RUMCH|nr:RelA/SpoT domain-containing protein [Ruminiclostridium cellulolyticum]ACL76180.1 RelA/SpoT domain protein [Ruminiclostridium cellulolyticum H10]
MTNDGIKQWFKNNKDRYYNFSEQLSDVIKSILNSEGIQYHTITFRVKDIDSLVKKIEKKKYKDPINQITDFSGLRIIAYTNSDVNKICYLLENEFCIDYINSNNKNLLLNVDKVGYRSIHYIVMYGSERLHLGEYKDFKDFKCEVQVRTLLEHAWAEIEHDRIYKSQYDIPDNLKRKFNLQSGNLELIDNEFDINQPN